MHLWGMKIRSMVHRAFRTHAIGPPLALEGGQGTSTKIRGNASREPPAQMKEWGPRPLCASGGPVICSRMFILGSTQLREGCAAAPLSR